MIKYHSCGVESYNMRTCWLLYSVSITYFSVSYDPNDWTSHLPSLCNLSVHCVDLDNGKSVSLTSHEASDRGWNVGHTPLLWHLTELCWQIWQLRVSDALHPHENFLGISSVRGWMHPRDTEFEQKSLTWKFSKHPQRTASPHAPVKMFGFVFQSHENKHYSAEWYHNKTI